jgi:hypothetical protein
MVNQGRAALRGVCLQGNLRGPDALGAHSNTKGSSVINEEDFSKDIARVLDLKSELKPIANGSKKDEKTPTLTVKLDEVIDALQTRIKWLEAIRSTL